MCPSGNLRIKGRTTHLQYDATLLIFRYNENYLEKWTLRYTIMYCKSSKYENQLSGNFIYALVGLFSLINPVKLGRMTHNTAKKILTC